MTTERVIYATYGAFGIAIGALAFLRRWVAYQTAHPRDQLKR